MLDSIELLYYKAYYYLKNYSAILHRSSNKVFCYWLSLPFHCSGAVHLATGRPWGV